MTKRATNSAADPASGAICALSLERKIRYIAKTASLDAISYSVYQVRFQQKCTPTKKTIIHCCQTFPTLYFSSQNKTPTDAAPTATLFLGHFVLQIKELLVLICVVATVTGLPPILRYSGKQNLQKYTKLYEENTTNSKSMKNTTTSCSVDIPG